MADAKRYAIKECQHTNILWLNHKAKLFFTLGFYQRKFKCWSSWTWLLCISLQCPHYYHAHFKRRPINLLSMRGWDSGPSFPLRMSTHLTDAQSIPQIVANHHYWLLKQWLSLSRSASRRTRGICWFFLWWLNTWVWIWGIKADLDTTKCALWSPIQVINSGLPCTVNCFS